jgi:hypothetical protein
MLLSFTQKLPFHLWMSFLVSGIAHPDEKRIMKKSMYLRSTELKR